MISKAEPLPAHLITQACGCFAASASLLGFPSLLPHDSSIRIPVIFCVSAAKEYLATTVSASTATNAIISFFIESPWPRLKKWLLPETSLFCTDLTSTGSSAANQKQTPCALSTIYHGHS